MQIAFNILTEGIEQMNNTNTAEYYKETAILVSNMLHFLDREFEYQCKLSRIHFYCYMMEIDWKWSFH